MARIGRIGESEIRTREKERKVEERGTEGENDTKATERVGGGEEGGKETDK